MTFEGVGSNVQGCAVCIKWRVSGAFIGCSEGSRLSCGIVMFSVIFRSSPRMTIKLVACCMFSICPLPFV